MATNVCLFTANGGSLAVHGRTKIDLLVDDKQYQLPVIVADLDGLQGILGIDFLEANDCSINVKNGYLDCGEHRHELCRLRQDGCQ